MQDPSFLLRVVVDAWDRAFSSELSKTDRNLVFELRDVRNKWAHNESFTVPDAHRALDTAERLLASVDAREAIEIGRSRDELMRRHYEEQGRRAAPSADALLTRPAGGLKPWRDVIEPHDDVAKGGFALAEFAADLHQVAMGEGAAEYADPVEFFRRTFLTAGLCQLLHGAVTRLCGRGGSPLVDLQTSFGGGKTHSMIALYHLCSGLALDRFPQEVQDLVRGAGVAELPTVRRAVLVGTWLAPGQPETKPDGTNVRTLWGELAWQLGGAEAFARVADADRTSTNPGSALRDVLADAGPCLILIDEWVAYARILYRDDTLPGGTFDTHFSFAQMLTEAARSLERALVVVSIPASDAASGPGSGSTIEVGGAGGRETLRRLRSVIGRMESSWRPATAEESFEIVRRRLFQPIDVDRLPDRDATARGLGDFYRSQASEFPVECREAAYVERIKRAYPIHPELFARLYEDWSTLDRFQRTRGVLRLMATVIHALWAGQDQSPVILPASVPLSDADVVSELTRNLEDNWKPILDADVDGPGSLPRALDDQFKGLGRYGAARRVARTVFLGSAPLAGTPNQGVDAARVRLGCALPGETVATFGDALTRLADRATYFYAGNGRYWYGTQPGVARLARDRAERLLVGDRHDVLSAVAARLKLLDNRRGGHFAGVHAAPGGPGDVRDEPSARLVILGPDTAHRPRAENSPALQLASQILDDRANGSRECRNMLVFLVADDRRVEDLLQAEAEHMGWKSVVDDADILDLSPQQQQQAAERRTGADDAVRARMAEAYQSVLVPRLSSPTDAVSWDEVKVDGQGDLVERAGRKLVEVGGIYVKYPPVLLRLHLDGHLEPLWQHGSVPVGQIWKAYSRYLYLHRLRDVGVLFDCVAAGAASTVWAEEGFAVAETVDPRTPGRYAGLVAGAMADSVRETTLVVSPDAANAQMAADVIAAETADDEYDIDADPLGTEDGEGFVPVERRSPVVFRRFYGAASLDPGRLARDAGKLAEEVVAHLNAIDGTDIDVTIEITATNLAGFAEPVRKLVSENAAALRLRQHGFEAT
jgi:predicted AAA+ superfamily ATPase